MDASPRSAAAALLDAARHSARSGAPRAVLVLHLSALADMQHYHAQVARVILTDAAQRLEGGVSRLATGDLALVCRMGSDLASRIGPCTTGPDGLRAVLGRLFARVRAKTPLTTVWRLPTEMAGLQAWLDSPGGQAAPPPRPLIADHAHTAVPGDARPSGSPTRQWAVCVRGSGSTRRLEPCFEHVAASPGLLADLVGRLPPTPELDRPGLEVMARQVAGVVSQALAMPPLHVGLDLTAAASPACAALAGSCRAEGRRFAVALSYADACADPPGFAAAAAHLRTLGAALVLDDVSADALALTRPARLGAALVKLDWTAGLAAMDAAQLAPALDAVGRARVVLQHVPDAAALHWGVRQGIRLFQGRAIDAMQAGAAA